MKGATLLGRFAASLVAGLAFAAAGERLAMATSELAPAPPHSLIAMAALVALGVVALVLAQVPSKRPAARSAARLFAAFAALAAIVAFVAPAFTLMR